MGGCFADRGRASAISPDLADIFTAGPVRAQPNRGNMVLELAKGAPNTIGGAGLKAVTLVIRGIPGNINVCAGRVYAKVSHDQIPFHWRAAKDITGPAGRGNGSHADFGVTLTGHAKANLTGLDG